MNKWQVPLFKIHWDEKDINFINRVIRRGAYWTTSPEVTQFEEQIADYMGCKYCITCNSGTSALHAMLVAYGIGPNDEVIVPSFTFIATVNAVLFVGAKPVFADIEETTFGLDPNDVKDKITSNTKAIIPVHFAGLPCLIRELQVIAKDHNLLLLEDAAEAMGAEVDNRKVGTFGDAAILSFCQMKIISTGEGGAVLTNSEKIYEKLKLIRSHGRAETTDYLSSTEEMDYISLGYNFRLSGIAAALGLAQLSKIDKMIALRQEKANYMRQQLSGIPQVHIPSVPANYKHVYQLYPIIITQGRKTRDSLKKYLADKGIMTKVHFAPVHLTYFYKNYLGGYQKQMETTERVSEQVLSLPMFPDLSKEDMDYMVNTIRAFF